MRQVQFTTTGNADVLHQVDVPMPDPSSGVIIRVAYVGLNYFDIMARRDGYRVKAFPYTPGVEVSGWVESVPSPDSPLKVGDVVAAFVGAGGGYSEYVVADEALVFKLDTSDGSLDIRAGAALLMVVPAAYDMLINAARMRKDDVVLIHGAAGGMGVALGQIAKLYGASKVLGTVGSEDKVSYAREHGKYDEVFLRADYEEAVKRAVGPTGITIELTPSGKPTSQLLAPHGLVVVYGNAASELTTTLTAGELLARNQGLIGFSITNLIQTAPLQYRRVVESVLPMVISGEIVLDITHEYSLEETAEAHRALESGSTVGKLLLKVRTDS
jgi:NADPH2:quinone reductase